MNIRILSDKDEDEGHDEGEDSEKSVAAKIKLSSEGKVSYENAHYSSNKKQRKGGKEADENVLGADDVKDRAEEEGLKAA